MISGIGWVSELVGPRAATMRFRRWRGTARRASGSSAPIRSSLPRPDIVIIGSWRGKKFRRERFAARPGF